MLRRTLKIIILFFSITAFSQENYTISGYVQDESSGENLIGVSIYEKETFKGTSSNNYGFYSLTLEEGIYEIIYSFIGMNTNTKKISLNKDIRLNVSLSMQIHVSLLHVKCLST